ncbi:MAG: hypothetical protein OEQ13_06340 [Acidobacteriota bacterium]|nr:hypothetical protein [Acidobacteriota bacterium]
MSRRARGPAPLWLAAAVLAAPFALACGHRGAPKPPLPRLPVTPGEDFWRQRGEVVEYRASFTLLGLQSRPLRPPAAPVVVYFPAGSEGLASGWNNPARAREFLRVAIALRGAPFEEEELGRAVTRETSMPLQAFGDAGAIVLALGLEDARSRSLPSPRRVLTPARPGLQPLGQAGARPEETGIRLTWEPPDDPRVREVRIYRFVDGTGDGWLPWRVVPAAERETFDETVQYGQKIGYQLSTAAEKKGVVVESSPVAQGPIDFVDVYPPAPPRELDAVAETGRVRVFWFEGGSADEAAVVIERQAEGELGYRKVGSVSVPDAWFEDQDVSTTLRYRYRAHGLDEAGNRSVDVGPTGWVSPRP